MRVVFPICAEHLGPNLGLTWAAMAERPGAPSRPPPWGLGQVVGGLAAGFLIGSLGESLAIAHLPHGAPLPTSAVLASLLGLWVGLVGAVVVSAVSARSNVRSEFGLALRPWPDIPLGVAVGAAFQLVVVPLLYLPFEEADRSLSRSLSAPARQLTGGSHGAGLVVVDILIVAGAPVVEELFFRGLLLSALEKRFAGLPPVKGRWLSVVITAVVFGLVHYEPLQLAGLVLFGLALGLLAQRTKRLGSNIVAHATFNGIAVIILATSH
jgi:uncharacterized protein